MHLGWLVPAMTSIMLVSNAPGKTLTFHSKSKDFSVLDDGVRVGGPGEKVSIKPGRNNFTLSAHGFVRRHIVFWHLDGQPKRLEVNFVPLKKRKPLTLPGMMRRSSKLYSICSHRKLKHTCKRQDWFEDLIYSGFFWDDPKYDSPLSPKDQLLINNLPVNRSKSRHPLYYVGKAEALLSRHPSYPPAYQLAARESLFKRDCQRVADLLQEAYSGGMESPRLFLTVALCQEALGDINGADQFIQANLKSVPSPEVHYNLGRMKVIPNPTKALKYALGCIKTWPGYFPCYQLKSQAEIMLGKKPKGVGEAYRQVNRIPVAKFITKLQKFSAQGGEPLKKSIQQFRFIYRTNFEPLAHLLALDPHDAQTKWLLGHATISSISMSSKLIKKIEQTASPDAAHDILRAAAMSVPTSRHFWWRLIQFQRKQGKCDHALDSLAMAKHHLKKLPRSFKFVEGACLVKVKSYKNAIKLFESMKSPKKEEWKINYNLAVAYDAAGDRSKATELFRKTLMLNPPEEVAAQIERRVNFPKKKRANKVSTP